MVSSSRRAFLTALGGGMFAAGLGTLPRAAGGLAARSGVWPGDEALDFGALEPLVALMQETAPDRLQELLVQKLRTGTELRTLVAAGALANSRTFGGHDYIGYHCMMALVPALRMAERLPAGRAPLPVLKVLYRSADRIQTMGGRDDEALRVVSGAEPLSREEGRARLRTAVFARDVDGAERAFSTLAANGPRSAYDDLQAILHENMNVHRVVLAWRSWETLDLTGPQHAETLLRQAVRYCVDAEEERLDRGKGVPPLRSLLPALMEDHGLATREPGQRTASDAEVLELSRVVFCSEREDAARAMADALAQGWSHADAGEAISLAANWLVLHDPGRKWDSGDDKPRGSVHGASVGVHACDAARAWRNIARVSNPYNAAACLVTGAFHAAGQSGRVDDSPVSFADRTDEVRGEDVQALTGMLREAVEAGDQMLACAVVGRWNALGLSSEALLDTLIDYALEQDGALHAEKFYHTVTEELAEGRPAFRGRHLLALARVTASANGWRAPGLAAARELLEG